jgi:NDP-sugar pyrophosphorylase family protein
MRSTTPAKKAIVNEPVDVIIPAATLKRKISQLGPVSLFKLGSGKTLIEDKVYKIKKVFGRADFYYVGGEQIDKIAPTNFPAHIRLLENELHEQTGTARSMEIASRVTKAPRVLIVYGDLYFDQSIISALVALNKEDCSYVLSGENQGDKKIGVHSIDKVVTNLYYDIEHRWLQIAYLTGKELDIFKKVSANPLNRPLLGFEIINQIIQEGGILKELFVKGYIFDVSKLEDIKRLKGQGG